MKFLQKLYNLNKGDSTPGLTRILTFYFMPIVFLGFGCFSFYSFWRSGTELTSYRKLGVTIKNIDLIKRSNNKSVETIYTDLVLYPADLEINFAQTSINNKEEGLAIEHLHPEDYVEVYYSNEPVKLYGPNAYHMVHLQKQKTIILSFNEYLKHWKGLSIISGVSAFIFIIWYSSRIYRYRKFGYV